MNTLPIPFLLLAMAVALAGCGNDGRGPSAVTAASSGDTHAHGDEAHDEGAAGTAAGHDDHDDHDDHDEAGDDGKHGHGEDAGHEEGQARTTIASDVARVAGIRTAPAAAGTIADEHEVQGLLVPVEGRVAHVSARFPGPIRQLYANVGDQVRAGQVLARVESNLSLTTYAVTSPISGVVLARNATPGAIAGESQALFEVGDLSSLWVDLHVFGTDMDHIQPGVPVTVTRLGDGTTTSTTLERVLPGAATASQSTIARAVIDNSDGRWRPGSAVKARITVAQAPAALVVPLAALQTLDGKDVVFVRQGEDYLARPVTLGARDARQVAVSAGLEPGEEVVVEQSYLIKADIGKAGASHEH